MNNWLPSNSNWNCPRCERGCGCWRASNWSSTICEALLDDDGTPWLPVGATSAAAGHALSSELELARVRDACRQLAITNEYAIGGHELRISYLVGAGHRYTAVPRTPLEQPLADEVQQVLDRFLEAQGWSGRQQEIVRRLDRDGECFLRFFPVDEQAGWLAVRFVEPEQVATPPGASPAENSWLGIVTAVEDVESVLGYYVDGRLIPAQAIQHRKQNVDRNQRRGLPTFYPVLGNLQRIEKLLRNMSLLAQTQAAIAVIRKHAQSSAAAVAAFADNQASFQLAGRAGSSPTRHKRLAPGTILDAPAGIEYQFPSIGVDASKLVEVLQAELRAVASRLVMPEFMLSADASNGSYASTLVAEGPAVKMFQRLQASLVSDDLQVMRRVIQRAVAVGRLPEQALSEVRIQTEAPTLVIRDRLADARANDIKLRSGVLSRRTWQLQEGLDPDQEQRNRAADTTAA